MLQNLSEKVESSTYSRNFAEDVRDLHEVDNEYTFVQLADVQIGMMAQMSSVQYLIKYRKLIQLMSLYQYDGKKTIPVPEVVSDDKALAGQELYEEQINLEAELAERAVAILNSLTPRPVFAIVCGDLTHSYPKVDGHSNQARQEEVRKFKSIWEKLDPEIQLVCVCGNHDVGEKPNSTTIGTYKNEFGKDYFAFNVGRDRMIVMNSQYYKDSSECQSLAQDHDNWLTNELSRSNTEDRRYTIVFSHIPPFIFEHNEPSAYFNLEREVRDSLVQRMFNANVTHWFCGHYHRNAVARAVSNKKALEVVTTGAVGGNLSSDPYGDPLSLTGMSTITASENLSGFRLVSVSDSAITHKYFTIKELENVKVHESEK